MASDRTLLEAARALIRLLHTDDAVWEQIAESQRLIEESRRLLARVPAPNPLIYRARQNSPEDKREA